MLWEGFDTNSDNWLQQLRNEYWWNNVLPIEHRNSIQIYSVSLIYLCFSVCYDIQV